MEKSINQLFELLRRLVFGAVGTAVVIGTIIWGISIRDFTERAATAEGTVVKLNAGGSHPEIRFTTAGGEIIEYPQGGLIGGYNTNDKVPVFYDPQNPRSCIINSGGALWGFPILSFILGLVFILIAAFSKSET